METLKAFIKHGKQARVTQPQAEPTTHVSPVTAHQQRASKTESSVSQKRAEEANMAYQARKDDADRKAGGKKVDPDTLARMVAEDNESKGKLPQYPGLERWRLVEKMGDGAFSNVYKAVDLEGSTGEVAIKVVRKFEMNSSQGDDHLHPDFKKPKAAERANILKEVQIMRQLDHPSIVKLIDFSESKQYYYIILELAPGGELFHQIVRLTYFSEDLSRHVITQVAEALEYLHEEKGVVHRDIKPENLLFSPIPFIPTKNPKPRSDEEEDKVDEGEFTAGVGSGGIGKIKIADFGLSKIVWDTQTMTPCGTVGYTAPEIVKDERYSKSVDMWAMGCVLYTLLCGFPPFYDESIQVLTEKVAKGQYTFLSPWWDDISKPAQNLVSHLLTVDPEKRYTIKEFLAHPWIKNTAEPTYAAFDAPPLATPAAERNEPLRAFDRDLLESPGTRRMDFRSPGAVNLREVFDVGYAVHRQEEEAKRRKNLKTRGLEPIGDENEGGMQGVEQGLRNTSLSAAATARQQAQPQAKGYGQHSPAVAAAARQQVKNQRGPFELNLDGATLLGRRGQKGPTSGLRESTTVK